MTLAADRIRVVLGSRPVVEDVTFTIGSGRLVALVGPNGAGKTSLLRALAGLTPSDGAIRLGGEDLRALNPKARARRIAYLPQGHEAHWPLPARDIVALGRLPHGAADPMRLSPADSEAVARAMRLADVDALADRPVTRLSGGERARVALARVLAVAAPLILADEPTAALDPRHQLDVMAVLRRAARDGASVIAVTHDLGLAARFADDVLVMSEGRLVASAPPAEAFAPDVLRDVFGIEAYRAEVAGETVLVPWA